MPLRRPNRSNGPAEKKKKLHRPDRPIHVRGDIYVRSAPQGTRLKSDGDHLHLVSPMNPSGFLAWDMCGGCQNYLTQCTCKRGITPTGSVRHLCGDLVTYETELRQIAESNGVPRRKLQRPSQSFGQAEPSAPKLRRPQRTTETKLRRPQPQAPKPLRRPTASPPTPPRNPQPKPAVVSEPRPVPMRRPARKTEQSHAVPDTATMNRMAKKVTQTSEELIMSRLRRPR